MRAGEIVGVAGLVGCGKSELAQACFGLQKLKSGRIRVDGEVASFAHPADAIAAACGTAPPTASASAWRWIVRPARTWPFPDCRGDPDGRRWLRPGASRRWLDPFVAASTFRGTRLQEPVANFSGGNQQKILVAKGLAQEIGVYVFDEPTVGVDIGARRPSTSALRT